MNTKATISIIFIASLTLAIVHYFSINLYWYYYFPYIDVAMHLLGGFVIGLFGYYILISHDQHISAELSFVSIITLLALVTVGWEIFEQAFSITRDAGFSADTMSDVIFGVVGGMVGWSIATQ